MPERYFSALVTRDITESARIPIAASSEQTASDQALLRDTAVMFAACFETDEGSNGGDPYFGDSENNLEEISESDYHALLADTRARQEQHYLVTGRIEGDDDDSAYIIQSESEERASAALKVLLWLDECKEPDDREVFVVSVRPVQYSTIPRAEDLLYETPASQTTTE